MTDTDILPPPDLKPMLNPPTKFAREMTAFRRLLPSLLEQYRDKYVAIHEEQVVGSGDELVGVALAAYDRFGYQPIHVDLVTDNPMRSVRIPHFKPLLTQASDREYTHAQQALDTSYVLAGDGSEPVAK